MNMNKFLFLVVAATITVVAAAPATSIANAQPAPPLELDKPLTPPVAEEEGEEKAAATPALGKITIQISQTEQIILDLPLKSDNTYQVLPIK